MSDMHRRTVIRAGVISIVTNLALTVVKIIGGALSGSLALMSDALHGLVDTLSGLVVIISEKITSKHAEVERVGARVIAVIIMLVAAHILVEAIQGLFVPSEINFAAATTVVLVISIAAKIALAFYLRKTAAAVHSATLKASSVESLNDSLISVAVLVSSLVYVLFHVNIEAYVSIILAVVIFKSGCDLFRPRKRTSQM